MQIYAFMAGFYILPIALIATALMFLLRFFKSTSPRPLTWIARASWAALGACVAFIVIAELLIGRWKLRGEYPSPDRRSVARVESQHSSFFEDYEVNFRLQIRDSASGRVVKETVVWEADVVHHPWEVPGTAVEWDPRSTEAVLVVCGKRVPLPR